MTVKWTSGNTLELLENGEAFFPAVFDAIRRAEYSVILETFIIFEDKVGNELRQVLIEAAQRGVRIEMTVDGYGSADLTPEYIQGLTSLGVGFHVFDPQPRRMGFRTNLFRRMHRKIVVVDGVLAFVGGINYSADHLADFGPTAKQDYAISIRGPLVEEIARFALDALSPVRVRFSWRSLLRRRGRQHSQSGETVAALVLRDNDKHTNDIEQHYRIGIRAAKHEITIANAYFFPGYRFLRDLRQAAKRGVRVRLILQGQPDMAIVRFAATMLYDYLLSAGVEIYEYCERPFHGKVATVDHTWATVGSSNLDPLSLALNLEANVMIHDRAFSSHLHERLEFLVKNHCRVMERVAPPRRKIQRVFVSVFVFHFLRRFPAWAGWLPAREAQLTSFGSQAETMSEGKP
ncbi:cardiolipin synthase ClsB [Pollutimonas nitritireducens]|uniref:Cardiolipin synthase B n=1 Tax=Pollutimonas nitritireducens TaxID=2045209 RepID=A0A2N4UGK8_9BURK|nr:cardiolipin synthase ClsB [Pollutimonas nitritireducens]PLC54140.1 cardiolipin synthase ClsB [Pollutimonas nitritireducens]